MGANQRGAEAVEFALVVPIFLLLVFGIVDFGYMINRDTMVNNASREGARVGALDPVTNDIECKVRDSLTTVEPDVLPAVSANCSPTGTKITVNVTCLKPPAVGGSCATMADAASGGTVIVQVGYQHSWITPLPSLIGMSGVIKLSKTTQMRIE
jgi:Flp pilus assembly protein TadG